MKKNFLFCIYLMITLVFASCISNDYDLEHIDYTVGKDVNNLTIPINVDKIKLNAVIKLNEKSIVQVVDGKYAVIYNGKFISRSVIIPPFNAPQPAVEPISITLSKDNGPTPFVKKRNIKQLPHTLDSDQILLASYPISNEETTLSYTVRNVSKYITSIDKVMCDYSIGLYMEIENKPDFVKTVHFENLSLQLPKGMYITPSSGTYDPQTGILTVGNLDVNGNKAELTLSGKGFNLVQAGVKLQDRSFVYSGKIYMKSGRLTIYNHDLEIGASPTSLPDKVILNVKPSVSAFIGRSIDGTLQYSINGLNFNEILLNSLPNGLDRKNTDIRLFNPQVYLSLNNPLGDKGLEASVGVNIYKRYGNKRSKPLTLNNDSIILRSGSNTEEYQYCLSPTKPNVYYKGFEQASHEPFTQLREMFSGSMPDAIQIQAMNPHIWNQKVENLELNKDLGYIRGKYAFVAPIELSENTVIVYTDTLKGWSKDGLEDLTLKRLSIKANVTTDIPVSLEMQAKPIDKDGNEIEGVELTATTIPGMSENQPVELKIKGDIKQVDGIVIHTKAITTSSPSAFAPTQYLELNDLKITVTGTYIYNNEKKK